MMKRRNKVTLEDTSSILQSLYSLFPSDFHFDIIQRSEIAEDIFNKITVYNDKAINLYNITMEIHKSKKLPAVVFRSREDSKEWALSIPVEMIHSTTFLSFLVGKTTFEDFLTEVLLNDAITDPLFDSAQMEESLGSWGRLITQLGYNEEEHLLNFDDKEIDRVLTANHVVWYYGTSCSGKTFMGIRELNKTRMLKIAFNPCFSSEYEYSFVRIMLCYGMNVSILLDDIQCDTEKAEELFMMISAHQNSFADRNVSVFIISWTSLLLDKKFAGYQQLFNAIESNPQRYISQMQDSVRSPRLRIICGQNLALLNAAQAISVSNQNENAEKCLFEYFVKTDNSDLIASIHNLCVLGSYEYLVNTRTSTSVTTRELTTIKIVNRKYYVGHKEICRFLSSYIKGHMGELGIAYLPAQNTIIRNYIQSLETDKQWKAIKQLIGEQGEEKLQGISPIWKGLHCFEQEIGLQNKKDATWGDAPSSMYFVLKVASLLGVLPDYKVVLSNFCNKFAVKGGTIEIKYADVATTNDFDQIKRRMEIEDRIELPESYEKGVEFDCDRAHKNWLLGLVVGLKDELCSMGHEQLYHTAIDELFKLQSKGGFWYPRRVPWITARILIGLSQAGFSLADHRIQKGVDYLFANLDNQDHWEAHTGGWNNPYETSSLCLEAIFRLNTKLSGVKKARIDGVIQYLLRTKKEWMGEDRVVDGSATACCLLKYHDYSAELVAYIQDLCDKRIYQRVSKNSELDLNEQQSCETTQIAWYVMDFCWDVFYSQLNDLLDQFISRSLKNKKQEDLYMGNGSTIFISYSEDSKSTEQRIKRISAYLRNRGYTVWCYADLPLGSNIVSFMQKAPQADLILIMGSKKYREKSLQIESYDGKGNGVFFEDLVLAQLFLSNNSDKIIPIAFERGTSFEESFPPPFSANKGMICNRLNEAFLDKLAQEICNKLGGK